MPDAATGINISATAWSFSLIFCGILVKPSALPRFWIFMYRASPITYFVQAIVSTGVSGVEIECAPNEIVIVAPPAGQSCESYLKQYIEYAGGRLLHPA
ncbi:hypothetical protein DSL72_003628 [Monilinia vaccinii-corymbosi]|uniref:ABC-2 type transporter transmembrane domain-containing protein n=1 Tax=Monilinia vaccinii-corymbosi TaxID=61207 RepID=A0A8A3P684_9HELO|nr:hypothetical protein DSL72_003628 [Monilinia vaccinii-corymbosi]